MKRSIPESVFANFEKTKQYKQAYIEACRELDKTPRHLLDEGNPNHPNYDNKLFGYDVEDFLAKQYKE